MNHVGEGEVGGFGVKARTFVAHESVFGWIKLDAVVDAGSAQTLLDGIATFAGNVRIVRTEDHQKFAADFGGLRERSGVGVFAKFSVVDAGAIKADGGANVGLKGGAKGEVATDAEAHSAEVYRSDFRMSFEPVERGAAAGVEIGDACFGGVVQAASAAGVVERNGAAGRFDAVIDLGRGDDETVTGESDARPEHWAGELEDVRVTEDGGKFAGGVWCGDKGPHGSERDGNINVGGFDDHCFVFFSRC